MLEFSKGLISVIVPVYNMEKYLAHCMDTILNQTYRNLEIILVDDGSTDMSVQMCDDYAKTDSRVKVIHKINGGLSDARNAGLKIATGEYIGYVDSDDWIEYDMYEKMYNACLENEAQVAVCRYSCEEDNIYITGLKDGNKQNEFNPCSPVSLTRDELLDIYICGHEEYIIYNSVWSKLFRRDIVDDLIFPKGHNSEDIVYTTKAFCRLKKAVYINTPLYHYVVDRAGSIMNEASEQKIFTRMFRDEIPFWREHIEYITQNVSKQKGELAAYYFWRRLLFYYVDAKNKGQKSIACKIADEILNDRDAIKSVYSSKLVSKGDKARMKLFGISPALYAEVVKVYEKFIIPLRA